jgi:hypothetical protein
MTDEVGVGGVEAGILAAELAGEEVQYLTELHRVAGVDPDVPPLELKNPGPPMVGDTGIEPVTPTVSIYGEPVWPRWFAAIGRRCGASTVGTRWLLTAVRGCLADLLRTAIATASRSLISQ